MWDTWGERFQGGARMQRETDTLSCSTTEPPKPKCAALGQLSTALRPGKVSIATIPPISHVTGTLLLMPRHIDLVLVFRAVSPSSAPHFSKQRAKQEAQDAEDQYSRLLTTLRNAGLYAVGRRGEHQGQLIILVSSSAHQLRQLLQRERQDTFIRAHSIPPSYLVVSTAIQTSYTASQPRLRMSIRVPLMLPNAYASCTRMLQPPPQTEVLVSTQTTVFGLA